MLTTQEKLIRLLSYAAKNQPYLKRAEQLRENLWRVNSRLLNRDKCGFGAYRDFIHLDFASKSITYFGRNSPGESFGRVRYEPAMTNGTFEVIVENTYRMVESSIKATILDELNSASRIRYEKVNELKAGCRLSAIMKE